MLEEGGNGDDDECQMCEPEVEGEATLEGLYLCGLEARPSRAPGREKLDIGIDTCAAASVLPRAVAKDFPIQKDGKDQKYFTATKQPIMDEGFKVVSGYAHGDGALLSATFRVAAVHRPLMSVSEMVDKDLKVIFDKVEGADASRIEFKKSGESVPIERRDKVYVLPLHLINPASAPFAGRGSNL